LRWGFSLASGSDMPVAIADAMADDMVVAMLFAICYGVLVN
jgi:hypothetical protein